MTRGLKQFGAAFLGLTVFAMLLPAAAKPLLSEICVKLAGEYDELQKSGIEASMDSDPAKAGDILKPGDLANIERYLFIEGQIRFRCPEIQLPGDEEPDPAKSEEGRIKEAKPAPPKKPSGRAAPLPVRKRTPLKKKAG